MTIKRGIGPNKIKEEQRSKELNLKSLKEDNCGFISL